MLRYSFDQTRRGVQPRSIRLGWPRFRWSSLICIRKQTKATKRSAVGAAMSPHPGRKRANCGRKSNLSLRPEMSAIGGKQTFDVASRSARRIVLGSIGKKVVGTTGRQWSLKQFDREAVLGSPLR